MFARPVLVALLLAACGPSSSPPAAPVGPPPAGVVGLPPVPEARIDGRLPRTAWPLRHDLQLDLDPAAEGFSGTMRITLRLDQPLAHVVLHARELRVGAARLAGQPATVMQRGHELVVSSAALLPIGEAVLELEFSGTYSTSLDGLYRAKGAVYSDFEPIDARKAFPCFDEPSYKAPYRVTVRVPKGQRAFSNAPQSAQRDEGDHTVYEFAETKPLPSYLVAVAAGDLAVLEGQKSPWPIRVIARPEALAGGRGQAALDTAAATLRLLEEWFGVPYAYEKLDLIGVPDFGSGAMENAGLITFREELLLVDPKTDSRRARRSMETVIVHELAHQWFGNLVTTAWWDDIWLNEGFASFMEGEILDAWKPDFGARLERIVDAQRAMEIDGLPGARQVRQPVLNANDAREAFDPITYDKGSMLLTMTQGWLGAPAFQQAVRAYVREHANGNASAADLFAKLDAQGPVGGKRVGELLSPYLDQPGVPWFGLAHADGAAARLRLGDAWTPAGLDPASPRGWPLVVCEAPRLCTVHTVSDASMTLGRGHLANAYARLDPQLGASDDSGEKLARTWNRWAVLRGAKQPVDKAYEAWLDEAVDSVKRADSRHFAESLVLQLGWLAPALPEAQRKRLRARLGTELGPVLTRLGKPSATESDDRAFTRRALYYVLGDYAVHAPTRKAARSMLEATLAGKEQQPDAVALGYELGTRAGDAELWNKVHARWSKADTATERTLLLRALLGFDDDAQLERTLQLVLEGKVIAQDVRYVIGVLAGRPGKAKLLDAWTQKTWSALGRKLAPPVLSRFSAALGGVCSRADIDASRDFYQRNVAVLEGAARGVELALQNASVCADFAKLWNDPVTK